MLRIAVALVVVLVLARVVFVATRPDAFRVERSATVHAPADVVFALIDDLHQFQRWNPYEQPDAQMKRAFEGPAHGPGARYVWDGGRKAGAGQLTLLESRPGERVVMRLDFFQPFEATNQATFVLASSGAATRVTWRMEGPNTLMGKVMSLFVSMDTFLGRQFEQGLANLDRVARAEVQQRARTHDVATTR